MGGGGGGGRERKREKGRGRRKEREREREREREKGHEVKPTHDIRGLLHDRPCHIEKYQPEGVNIVRGRRPSAIFMPEG